MEAGKLPKVCRNVRCIIFWGNFECLKLPQNGKNVNRDYSALYWLRNYGRFMGILTEKG